MIHAIAKLGEYEMDKNPDRDILDLILDNAHDEGRYPHLFVLVLKKAGNILKFDRIDYTQLNKSFKSKILYKKGTSKGTDFTPTSKIAELPQKTFTNKILQWFNQNKDQTFLSEDEKKFLNQAYTSLNESQTEIIDIIKNKIQEIQDKKGIVLTVGFDCDSQLNYISHYDCFKKILNSRASTDYKYSQSYKTYSFSKNKLCAITNEIEPEVFGFFTELKFYNVDKAGMITGGFQHENSWKNYPVSNKGALMVRTGFNYLQSHLDFSFYGLRYYFIPKISEHISFAEIMEALIDYHEQTFKTKDIERITNDENELFEYIHKKNINLSFDLLYYQKDNAAFRILALIEDIIPTRIATLFEFKKKLDDILFFKDAKTKEDKQICYFNFGIVRNFFPNTKLEGNKDKSFLEITEKIFKGKPINSQFVIQNIMQKLRPMFARGESVWINSLKGFMLLLFLFRLNLIKGEKEINMDNQIFKEFIIHNKDELEDKVEHFFGNFGTFFSTDFHRSIFLIGVISQFLLNIQKQERGATPFRSKLKGLKMNAYDISILLPEIIDKLEQYKKNFYRPLEELISKYLISSGNYKEWRLPVDEMNFVFVLGMNLAKYFKIKSDEEKEVSND